MFWFSCVLQITFLSPKKVPFLKFFCSLSLGWINFKLWLCTSRNLTYFLTVSHVRNRPAEINANWVGDKCDHSPTSLPRWKSSYILAKHNIFLSLSSSSYFSKSNRHYSPLTNSETDSLTSRGVRTSWTMMLLIISIPAMLRGLWRQAGQKCKLLILPQ